MCCYVLNKVLIITYCDTYISFFKLNNVNTSSRSYILTNICNGIIKLRYFSLKFKRTLCSYTFDKVLIHHKQLFALPIFLLYIEQCKYIKQNQYLSNFCNGIIKLSHLSLNMYVTFRTLDKPDDILSPTSLSLLQRVNM